MHRLLIATLITICLTACADNPLGLAEGMWVRNKIDGQKYYITKLDLANNAEHGGIVRVKNELGVEVEKDFAVYDFELWIERKTIPDDSAESVISQVESFQRQLDLVKQDLEVVKKIVKANSDDRHWNPKTEKYE